MRLAASWLPSCALGWCAVGWCAAGCGAEIGLFQADEFGQRTDPSESLGGSPGMGDGMGGDPGAGLAGSTGNTETGFPSNADLLALRIVVLSKQPTQLGTQFRTVIYLIDGAPNFPEAPVLAEDPIVSVGQNEGSANPLFAFDDDEQTWWELREMEGLPGFLEISSTEPIPIPSGVFIHMHQSAERAPIDFDFRAFDGENWWVVLAVRGLDTWAEPQDEVLWQRDQRSFSFPPPEQWMRLE